MKMISFLYLRPPRSAVGFVGVLGWFILHLLLHKGFIDQIVGVDILGNIGEYDLLHAARGTNIITDAASLTLIIINFRQIIRDGDGVVGTDLLTLHTADAGVLAGLAGIGTFCHEFSHCLGLPDFYDTSGRSYANFGMDYWDLMDYGCYNLDGYVPIGYNAYERDFMGWRKLQTLTERGHYSLKALTAGGTGYKVVNNAN